MVIYCLLIRKKKYGAEKKIHNNDSPSQRPNNGGRKAQKQ